MSQNNSTVRARRDDLVARHLHLVEPIARGVCAKLPPSIELDDLVGAGNLALIRAAARYSPEEHGGAPFSAYARQVIRGAMIDSIKGARYRDATHEAIDAAVETGSEPDMDAQIDAKRKAATVKKVVEMLPQQHRAVVERYYVDEEPTFERVAAELQVSIRTVKLYKSAAVAMIRVALHPAA